MQIQWYPGHMFKASKELKKILPSIDLLIEILDARIPFSSENPMLANIRGDKPCIKILNKSDLADPTIIKRWQEFLEDEKNTKTLAISNQQSDNQHFFKAQAIPELCYKLIPSKKNKDRNIHALIMGIPNVGKSTIINTLAGRSIAKTGNEPAVTKHQQRINLNNGITLVDTPGMLWANIENPHSGYRLAITGAIKDTALEYEDIAYYLAEYLLKNYPTALLKRFQLDELPHDEYEFFEIIGKKRGCIRAGNHLDLNRISKIFITEFRDGKLGNISLETPQMMQQELIEVAKRRELKAAKKAARRAKR